MGFGWSELTGTIWLATRYDLGRKRARGWRGRMFTNKTVFVLGAGASWHYGCPTGEGLTDSVISMATRLSAFTNAKPGRPSCVFSVLHPC